MGAETCEHGSLRRQCALCDALTDLVAAEAREKALRGALESARDACDPECQGCGAWWATRAVLATEALAEDTDQLDATRAVIHASSVVPAAPTTGHLATPPSTLPSGSHAPAAVEWNDESSSASELVRPDLVIRALGGFDGPDQFVIRVYRPTLTAAKAEAERICRAAGLIGGQT